MASSNTIDALQLRRALGTFVTGVTVITTLDAQGRRYGLTANSFSSVSLDPPLILWSLSNTAPSFPVFQAAERFVVNILAEDQVAVSGQFASRADDKFAGIDARPGIGGLPLIQGCTACLQCRKVATHPGGDHAVFIGQVEEFHHTARTPLVFGGGDYLTAEPHEFGRARTAMSQELVQLRAIRLGTRAVVNLARQRGHTYGVVAWGNRGPTVVRWEAPATPFTLHLPIGEVLPLLNSASGLAFAAHLPEATTHALVVDAVAADAVAGLPGATLEQVRDKLATIRQDGAARIAGKPRPDVPAVSGMSVPVFDGRGIMVCALTAIGAGAAFDGELHGPLGEELKAVARQLSSQLGYEAVSAAPVA
ncbi:flavin reductase [Pigmentiphaga sp.]|uniref:flavin reductase n=1 Tax=Pigmentiphaga sp. TaxID=1977564 RepID=UPI00128C1022|nr:flavin reductase [Pigmentiphaga sp.]MPS30078.1 flavin reductase [Alcaligenaceae bacterium SAGV5]MPS51850.1 flavin reductase [Alcaligenaceae bacterium SAGV3]MPT56041.1 flavin reductase [Alcaligenaceae bacterium]